MAQETYAPYGAQLTTDDDNINTQWYDGKLADKATGLEYYNTRYYDPAIGRFISPDP